MRNHRRGSAVAMLAATWLVTGVLIGWPGATLAADAPTPTPIPLGSAEQGGAKIGLAVGSDGTAHVAWVETTGTVKYCRVAVGATACSGATTIASPGATRTFVAMTSVGQPTVFTECNCYHGSPQVTQWLFQAATGTFTQRQDGASSTPNNPHVIGSGVFPSARSDFEAAGNRLYALAYGYFDAMPGGVQNPTAEDTGFLLSPYPAGTTVSNAVAVVGADRHAVAVFSANGTVRERHLPAGANPDVPSAWTPATQVESFGADVDLAGNAGGATLFEAESVDTPSVRRRAWDPESATFGAASEVASGAVAFGHHLAADRSEIDGRYHVAWDGTGNLNYATGRASGARWTAPVSFSWPFGVNDLEVAGTSPGRAWIATTGGGKAHLIPIPAPPDAGGDPDIELLSNYADGVELAAGETRTLTVELWRLEESTGPVAISASSPTLGVSVTPATTTDDGVALKVATTVPAGVQPGSKHTVTVTATPQTPDAGTQARTHVIDVTIAQPPAPTFELALLDEDPLTLEPGKELTAHLAVRRLNGHDGLLTLAAAADRLTATLDHTEVDGARDADVALQVVAPEDAPAGEHVINVSAKDERGRIDTLEVKITVEALRSPPEIVSHSLEQTIPEGSPIKLSVVAQDAQTPADKLTISITRIHHDDEQLVVIGGNPLTDVYATKASPGAYMFRAVVTDSDGDKASVTGTVTVKEPPSFTWAVTPRTRNAKAPDTVTFDVAFKRQPAAQGVPIDFRASLPSSVIKLHDEPKMIVDYAPKAGFYEGKPIAGVTGDKATVTVKVPKGRTANQAIKLEARSARPDLMKEADPPIDHATVQVRKNFNLVAEDMDILQTVTKTSPLPDFDNSDNVRLIRGKKTIARIYVRSEGADAPAPLIWLFANGDGVSDHRMVYDGPKVIKAGRTFRTERWSATNAYTLELPSAWTKAKNLQLRAAVAAPIDPKGQNVECGGPCIKDNAIKETVAFHDSKTIYVNALYVRYSNPDGTVVEPTFKQIYDSLQFTEMIWPLRPGGLAWGVIPGIIDITPWLSCQAESFFKGTVTLSPDDCRAARQRALRDEIEDRTEQGYVGAFAGMMMSSYDPGFYYPDTGITGLAVDDQKAVAHEIGHYLGRQHSDTACQTPGQTGFLVNDEWGSMGSDLGIDPRVGSGTIDGKREGPYRLHLNRGFSNPERAWTNGAGTDSRNAWLVERFDLMSYCSNNRDQLWISAESSDNAHIFIQRPCFAVCDDRNSLSRYNKGLPAPGQRQSKITGPVVRVLLQPTTGVFTTRGLSSPPALTGTATGVELVARDAGGVEIARTAMLARPRSEDSTAAPWLHGDVPAVAASFEVVADNAVLGARQASVSAPTVAVTDPKPGAVLPATGDVDIRWQASDPDGGTLTSRIEYSADGGATWRTIASGSTTGSAKLPAAMLAATTKGKLRVTVQDGWRTATAESGLFTASGGTPQVLIGSPAPSERPRAGQEVVADGTAIDPAGGPMADSALSWTLDGRRVGTGRRVVLRNLKKGRRVLVLKATANGKTATATRAFKVGAVKPRLAVVGSLPKVKRGARSVKLDLVAGPGRATLEIAGSAYRVSAKPKRFTIRLPRRGARRIGYTITSFGTKAKGTLKLPRKGR